MLTRWRNSFKKLSYSYRWLHVEIISWFNKFIIKKRKNYGHGDNLHIGIDQQIRDISDITYLVCFFPIRPERCKYVTFASIHGGISANSVEFIYFIDYFLSRLMTNNLFVYTVVSDTTQIQFPDFPDSCFSIIADLRGAHSYQEIIFCDEDVKSKQ